MQFEELTKMIEGELARKPMVLDLNGKNIGDEHVKMIVEHQQKTPSIRALSLNNNRIGDAGFSALEELVKSSPNLLKLTARVNVTGKKANKRLAKAILKNRSIIKADIPFTYGFTGNNAEKISLHCMNNVREAREIIEMIIVYPEEFQRNDFKDVRDRIGIITFIARDEGADKNSDSAFARNLAEMQKIAKRRGVKIRIPEPLPYI